MTPETNETVALLLYKEKHAREMFKTTSMTRGYGKIIRHTKYKPEDGVDVPGNLSDLLLRFGLFNLPTFDLLASKPEQFSDEEWACWIYGQNSYSLK